jgi:hypothetical protein
LASITILAEAGLYAGWRECSKAGRYRGGVLFHALQIGNRHTSVISSGEDRPPQADDLRSRETCCLAR